MLSILKKTFGDTNERRINKYRKIVDQINLLEEQFEKLTDEQLKEKTNHFKDLLANGATVDDIKVEAFAVVREASKRVLGLRHHDVQLIGGMVLTEGNIAEMPTGEGKTLVASLPTYLRALEGKGVHVITVNDYLASRDFNLIGQIHKFLGLTVGLNIPMISPEDKKQAYNADITYGIGTEFGFDYLRDNMAIDSSDRVQRPYHFAIIDEVDSVLIDEAKTPLIIAGKMGANPDLHFIAARLAKRFKRDEDYTFDEESKATNLTEEGISKVEKAFGVDNLYELEHQTLFHYVIQALRAHVIFERDVDYIVSDGKIALVDMFTGRIMEGRSLSDGLHQAIEAKEKLTITDENKTQASITIQNYFRMYPNLSGMTGTAKTEEKEFQQVYGMDVIKIPTNRPVIRQDREDQVYLTKEQKYNTVLQEVKKCHETGQPVLIGTTSILQSETVAEYLSKENLEFEILNAKSVEQEVELISRAGQRGHITIATNMAGRGTDILLGEGVAELGGLHVIGTEKHESRRVDNQLKGRAGRQGDPGSSQFIISLEDDMFRRFAFEELEKMTPNLKTDENGLVQGKKIHEFVDKVQLIVEGINFSIREYNLKLDDVVNEQRNVVYTIRNKVLSNDNPVTIILPYIRQTCQTLIDEYCNEELGVEDWDLDQLKNELAKIIIKVEIDFPSGFEDKSDIVDIVFKACKEYEDFIESYRDDTSLQNFLRYALISLIDVKWMKHLEDMTRLKEGIGLRQYQQEDPMRLYQNDGLELFTMMFAQFQKEACLQLAKILHDMTENGQQ
ncbi:accessory Sec system translocase SecA2 [Fredinandcohnia quinoae]|uniref:Protein translocase subunit SecA n=1 Tax=Fredinandcohnia quinoae TaxID=2918902 RepID=A0AAW5E8J3_9BACI|nr:accessory Sec system translocase SecA2 [Fredinandcohnia sp. SECRCQ15]MCH1625089.1 accessory Sec system translocase SecA2 [Fredinandcohnia sp. SECRCQ15]